MKKLLLVLMVVTSVFAIISCGGSGSSSSTSTPAVTPSTEATATETFAAVDTTVESVTPRVNFTAANTNLDDWANWRDSSDDVADDPMTQLAVFEKLLSDSAESVFAPVEFLVEITSTMEIVDAAGIPEWDAGGTATISQVNPETSLEESMSVTITIPSSPLTIPTYFQDKIESAVQTSVIAAINRILNFQHGDWDIYLAIGEDDDYYYVAATAENETLNETQTFVGYMNRTTETLTLHYASADDDNAEGGIYTRWTGNPTEAWFKIAQVSGSSGGNQEVVGGGSDMDAAGSIAFKARNNDDDSGDSTDVYYLADLTTANIEDDIDPGFAPTLGEPATGTGSIEYIIEGNDNCLGWIGSGLYPANRAAIAWTVE